MLKIKNILAASSAVAFALVASSAFATNTASSSWAVVSFDQDQSGVRVGTTPYNAQQNANVVTQTKYGSNALAQSSGTGTQNLTVTNNPFSQAQNGTFGSALTWQAVSGCGNPTPCGGSNTGLSNMQADTTGLVNQAQRSDDSNSVANQAASTNQLSNVGADQSALTGTISQNSTRVVIPTPAPQRWDPQQTQTITGKTHSEGVVFIPVTSVFTDISHFIQTITVTAQNILSF